MVRWKKFEIEFWKTEPTYVAKYGDELWLGVKG